MTSRVRRRSEDALPSDDAADVEQRAKRPRVDVTNEGGVGVVDDESVMEVVEAPTVKGKKFPARESPLDFNWLCTLGDGAHLLAAARVLVVGCGRGVAETAKTIALCGVRNVSLCEWPTESDAAPDAAARVRSIADWIAGLPGVPSSFDILHVSPNTVMEGIGQFECVVAVDAPLSLAMDLNQACRETPHPSTRSESVPFVSCWASADAASVFVDRGNAFTVVDPSPTTFERRVGCPIVSVSSGPAKGDGSFELTFTVAEWRRHGLDDVDGHVTFVGVPEALAWLEGRTVPARVVSPHVFAVQCDEASARQVWSIVEREGTGTTWTLAGGLAMVDAPTTTLSHAPLRVQLESPSFSALSASEECASIHTRLRDRLSKQSRVDSAQPAGSLACGGIAAMEAVKATSRRFVPISQWAHVPLGQTSLRACEQGAEAETGSQSPGVKGDLGDARVLILGSGCVAAEVARALLNAGVGVRGASADGKGTILLAEGDACGPGVAPSESTASLVARKLNDVAPGAVVATGHQFNPSERAYYSDPFLASIDVVVNCCLGSLTERHFVDARCLAAPTACVDVGTHGTMGHVQAIVPHVTEPYSASVDPDFSVDAPPQCVLKSFPATPDHCVAWAHRKFLSSFSLKPSAFSEYVAARASELGDAAVPSALAESVCALLSGAAESDADYGSKSLCARMLARCPGGFEGCVRAARARFDKYFQHKAMRLLSSFPPSHLTDEGTPFWAPPRRQPAPVDFDANDSACVGFVRSCALLLAYVYGVQVPSSDVVDRICASAFPASAEPTEGALRPHPATGDSMAVYRAFASEAAETLNRLKCVPRLAAVSLSRVGDMSSVADEFIHAAANLRARTYFIPGPIPTVTSRALSHGFVPSLPPVAATVAGLAASAAMGIIANRRGGSASAAAPTNYFFNAATCNFVASSPLAPARTQLGPGVSISAWDRWEVTGHADMTLGQFCERIETEHGLSVTGVFRDNSTMVYMALLPAHAARRGKRMRDVLDSAVASGAAYIDLIVSFEDANGDDVNGPPVRYFFGEA